MNQLYHYGKKGMKWGVRKSPTVRDTISKSYGGGKAKKRDPKRMSDQELNQQINRMRLEKQYKDLNRPVKKEAINIGKKTVSTIAAVAVGAVLAGTAKKYSSAGIEKVESLLKKKLNHSGLYHFGIKGMRWGKRKPADSSDSLYRLERRSMPNKGAVSYTTKGSSKIDDRYTKYVSGAEANFGTHLFRVDQIKYTPKNNYVDAGKKKTQDLMASMLLDRKTRNKMYSGESSFIDSARKAERHKLAKLYVSQKSKNPFARAIANEQINKRMAPMGLNNSFNTTLAKKARSKGYDTITDLNDAGSRLLGHFGNKNARIIVNKNAFTRSVEKKGINDAEFKKNLKLLGKKALSKKRRKMTSAYKLVYED